MDSVDPLSWSSLGVGTGARSGKMAIERTERALSGRAVYIPPFAGFRTFITSIAENTILRVRVQIVGSDGVLRIWDQSWEVVGSGPGQEQWSAPEGWLISAAVIDEGGFTRPFDSFFSLNIITTPTATAPVLASVLSGWVDAHGSVSFPLGRFQSQMSTDVPVSAVVQAAPAAGAEWSLAGMNSGMVKLHAVRFRLVTDANVASREVSLLFQPDVGGDFMVLGTASQTAGTTRDYYFSHLGVANFTSSSAIWTNLPELGLPLGSSVSSSTPNLQAGDKFSNITVWGSRFRGSV